MAVPDAQGRFDGGERYQIVREIGRGGMGVVYLGRDLRRDMDVAIKVRAVTHHAATLWLKREFRAVAPLRHPNLVELYELVAHDESCYFTMEFLPGVDPRRYVERAHDPSVPPALALTDPPSPSLFGEARTELDADLHVTVPRTRPPGAHPIPDVDFARVRRVIAQLADGLAHLHAHGVIHRDVKPSNAIVTDGTCKLLDFGLALERENAAAEIERETRVVGTAAYLAPEYVEQLSVSPAMDVYALGVVAYELMTGDPPVTGTRELLARLGHSTPAPRPSAINAAVPPDLDELVAAMLAPDPLARPTAAEIGAQLADANFARTALRRAPRFVGRAREVARIAERIAGDAPAGRLVLVTGPSGVGKSALVDAAVGRAPPDMIVWRGRCHEREQVPYRAFDFVLDDLATELAYHPSLARALEHAGALARVFPTLGAIALAALGRAAPLGPQIEDPRAQRDRAHVAMCELFRKVAEPRALLVLDDLQWADDDSLELLAVLVEKIARPLTIVATWTTGDSLPALPSALLDRLGAAAERIEVAPMAADDLAALIADLAPETPVAHRADGAQLAAGSPYLAELIGRELAATAASAEPSDPDATPEGRRLGRLHAGERRVAELASLAGGAATFEQLRALAAVPAGQLWIALRVLEDERIVRATPSPAGDAVYIFYHQRLREAAVAAIAPAQRAHVHRRYAELLEQGGGEPTQLAYHWTECGEPLRAARAAVAAAEQARAQLAWGLAADWYGRALAQGSDHGGDDGLGDGLDDVHGLRVRRAEALALAGKLADAADAWEALARGEIASATGAADGDRHFVRAAEACIKLGEIPRGLAILDGVLVRRGYHRATPASRTRSALRAAGVAARWLVPDALRPAPERAEADEVVAHAYRVIASFLSTPYPIESFEYVMRGIEIAARGGDRAAHAQGMAMLAAYIAAGSLGRFGDRAIATAQRLAIASGEPYPRMVAAGVGGLLAMLRGHWTAMRAAHTEGRAICTRLGMERSWEASFLHMYWALGEIFAGEPARALAILAERKDEDDDMISRALVGIYRGRAHVLAGDLAPARALASQLDRTPAARLGIASHYRQIFAAELALASHDWREAARLGDALAASARAEWLAMMPTFAAMVDAVRANADLGLAVAGHDRAAADRARDHAKRLYRRNPTSFFAPAALRMWGQADQLLGRADSAEKLYARARVAAAARGSRVEQLAVAALADGLTGGTQRAARGPLSSAVVWATGAMVY